MGKGHKRLHDRQQLPADAMSLRWEQTFGRETPREIDSHRAGETHCPNRTDCPMYNMHAQEACHAC